MLNAVIAWAVLALVISLMLISALIVAQFIAGYRADPDVQLLDELKAREHNCMCGSPSLGRYFIAKPLGYVSPFTLGRRARVAVLVMKGKCFGVQYAEDYYAKELNGKHLPTRDA